MPTLDDPVGRFYPDWPQYASRMATAIGSLSDEQLALRASPAHLPIWGLAAHVAGSRTYWLCGILGEPGADKTPFVDPLAELGWEDVEDHPRTAAELVWALESTWAVVEAALARWTLEMLDQAFERGYREVVQRHTRGSVLNRLFSHDAYHAGEISQLLGVNGLAAIDLWARRSRA